MAARHVMVEINLTSNDVILGVSGRDHPLPLYRSSGVPVALSTDDEGVSRIDITHEYVRAVQTYGFGYADLKRASADRCPRSLGTFVKVPEVQYHHEVYNQYLWNKF